MFITGVKQTVCQLSHNDIADMNLIKTSMPADIYGTLYQVQELYVAVAMVKDINAQKPELRAATGTTQFSMQYSLKTKPQNSEGARPRFTFSEANLCDNTVGKRSVTMPKLLHVQKESKHYWAPYKFYFTSSRRGHG